MTSRPISPNSRPKIWSPFSTSSSYYPRLINRPPPNLQTDRSQCEEYELILLDLIKQLEFRLSSRPKPMRYGVTTIGPSVRLAKPVVGINSKKQCPSRVRCSVYPLQKRMGTDTTTAIPVANPLCWPLNCGETKSPCTMSNMSPLAFGFGICVGHPITKIPCHCIPHPNPHHENSTRATVYAAIQAIRTANILKRMKSRSVSHQDDPHFSNNVTPHVFT